MIHYLWTFLPLPRFVLGEPLTHTGELGLPNPPASVAVCFHRCNMPNWNPVAARAPFGRSAAPSRTRANVGHQPPDSLLGWLDQGHLSVSPVAPMVSFQNACCVEPPPASPPYVHRLAPVCSSPCAWVCWLPSRSAPPKEKRSRECETLMPLLQQKVKQGCQGAE